MRNVILHYHVFKNAGSSVDEWLRRNLGAGACARVEGDRPRHTIEAEVLARHVVANTTLRAVSSHQARLPPPRVEGIRFHPIVFLRHPVDRAGSVYAFEKRQAGDAPGVQAARSLGFADYVRWRLAPGHGCVISNFQTLHLSGAHGPLQHMVASDSHLADARERLAALPCFGLVERFAESLAWISAELGPAFSMHAGEAMPAANASTGRAPGLAARLQAIAAELGPALHAELLERNRHDLALYASASSRFDAESVVP